MTAASEADFALLSRHLVPIEMDIGETLHRAGDTIEHVYFPEGGFISAMAVLSDGSPLEIGLIGAEGVAGVSVILGATTSYSETMCQTGGAAHRVSVAAFNECSHPSAGLARAAAEVPSCLPHPGCANRSLQRAS